MDTIVFTDGSVINNCRKSKNAAGGIGIFFGVGDPRNLSEKFNKYPITNQRTELYAILKALQIFIETEKITKTNKTIKNLVIYSDSMYSINTYSKWKNSWKKKGWKKADGKTPLNMDIIMEYDKLENEYRNINIIFKHVKSHKNEPRKDDAAWYIWHGNDQADKLSRICY